MRTKTDLREAAVRTVAREVLAIELSMEHVESERRISMRELRRLLELAYDRGRKDGLS